MDQALQNIIILLIIVFILIIITIATSIITTIIMVLLINENLLMFFAVTLSFVCPHLDYFAQHLGGYVNVLSALESLNIAILKAMDKTKEVRCHSGEGP